MQAGLVSYMVIIIVSLTSIAGFILSSSRLNNATRILTRSLLTIRNGIWSIWDYNRIYSSYPTSMLVNDTGSTLSSIDSSI